MRTESEEGFCQKDIDAWFKREFMIELVEEEKSLGLMYRLMDNHREDDDKNLIRLININISYSMGRILWLRKRLQD